jgi:catechol 2,3-dioxygenase
MASIDSATRIGHVHLKVGDWQRSLDFYVGVLGFELMRKFGDQAAFILTTEPLDLAGLRREGV